MKDIRYEDEDDLFDLTIGYNHQEKDNYNNYKVVNTDVNMIQTPKYISTEPIETSKISNKSNKLIIRDVKTPFSQSFVDEEDILLQDNNFEENVNLQTNNKRKEISNTDKQSNSDYSTVKKNVAQYPPSTNENKANAIIKRLNDKQVIQIFINFIFLSNRNEKCLI